MKQFYRIVISVISLYLLVIMTGCSDQRVEGVLASDNAQRGAISLTVKWPDAGRVIPPETTHIDVTVVKGDDTLAAETIERLPGATEVTREIHNLPWGIVNVLAQAKDAAGTVLATSGYLETGVIPAQVSPVTIRLATGFTGTLLAFNWMTHQIYTLNADGANLRCIGSGLHPRFDSTGTKIVYASSDAIGIYTMNIDGGDVTQISEHGEYTMYPCFSPDGSKIAFAGNRAMPEGGMAMNVCIMNADGTGEQVLTRFPEGTMMYDVTFSPDGQEIAFAAMSSDFSRMVIYTIHPDGSNLKALTPMTGSCAQPGYTPDGSRIAFYADVTGNLADIYTMDRDGGNDAPLLALPGWQYAPVYSPDGACIAYSGNAFDDPGRWPEVDICVMRADGSGSIRLTDGASGFKVTGWIP